MTFEQFLELEEKITKLKMSILYKDKEETDRILDEIKEFLGII